ncbi:MAG: UDP-N-acetylmuramoyl-tripeptide--D-alanyl-D-alanine ligase [Lachnospiraceae bacterium]|nr:UDP-N-acetylmuramoyl-tripeptide--D-alanyl-D-alanine ligase [Lachnospiraceae bacterium]
MISLIIRTVITLILSVIAYIYCIRYNLHMFQLNGYKNREHMSWLHKYMKRQWVLYAGILLSVISIFLGRSVAADIPVWLWLMLIIVVYRALNGMSVKKKLVYTARVKRLTACIIVTDIIILGIGTVTALKLSGPECAFVVFKALLLTVVSLKFVSCVICNVINTPIEKGVNAHFINDAKRRLKDAPDMSIIGVTGSYGKTSVKYYLKELLSVKYNVLITPESFNTPMGVVRTVREHLKPGTDIFVCEMGARHVGDIKELCELVHPDHGIITSIGPQHLDTFYTIDNIISTKYELADSIPEGGKLFLNGDNEYVLTKAGEYKDPIMYYSESGGMGPEGSKKGYQAENITLDEHGTSFDICTPDGERESYQMQLIGAHNVINVVGAIAVAHEFGIPLRQLRIPVRRLQAVKHRLELIRRGDMYIIDDAYNSNPVGSSAALDTLDMFKGLKVMITPGMVELGDKEEEYNREFGRHAAAVCDHILLVGRRRAIPIYEGAVSAGIDEARIKVFDRFEDAYSYAQGISYDGMKYILLENDLPDNY